MVASGFAALGYQIVWTQQNAQWLGHEAPAMLAIVAAFFGGIGLGALILGPRVDASARPTTWYAVCEAVVAAWALALMFLAAPAARALLGLVGAQPTPLWHWSVAFGGTFLLLLPATVAMGATLPAMERMLAATRTGQTQLPMLYAANTFGAVLGVLVTAFLIVPRLGLTAAASICAAANLLCAVAASKVFASHVMPAPVVLAPTPVVPGSRSLLVTLAATGLLGIGYEVLVVRVLSQVAENTIFTFAILLAVYLVGTALGAAAATTRLGQWKPAFTNPANDCDRLLRWQALSCLTGIVTLAFAERVKTALLALLGGGMGAALAIECLQACAVFLVPTMVMGALFSHLASAARAGGTSLGTALGVNTVAASLAPLLFGVCVLPLFGSAIALLLVAAGYLLMVSRRNWLSGPQLAIVSAVAALAFWLPPLALITLPAGGRLVSQVEGVAATVSVVEDADGVIALHINNRQQEGSSATLFADSRQGVIPILLHPAPRRALFLGLGTGTTARFAGLDPDLRVDAVELLPEVVGASAIFAEAEREVLRSTPRLLIADARRFIRTTAEHYDVIVSDNFHPARSGSASLYTVEHFAAVRERLAPGGVFCQWLPLHQLDLATLRSIVRSYTHVYPNSWTVLATHSLITPVIGLVARRDGESLDRIEIDARLAAPRLAQWLPQLAFGDDLALLGTFVAGPRSLARFSSGAPLNTDDRPVVAYLAPRITYAPDSSPRDRLLAFIAAVDIGVDELVLPGAGPDWERRLTAYWAARDRYLEIGRDVTPTSDVRQMLAQVRAPLLSVLEISADFRPAYEPLMQMAQELSRYDAPESQALLQQLAQLKMGSDPISARSGKPSTPDRRSEASR